MTISVAFCTTINRAILITAERIGEYVSGALHPPFRFRFTANAARAHVKAQSYSDRMTFWSRREIANSMQALCTGVIVASDQSLPGDDFLPLRWGCRRCRCASGLASISYLPNAFLLIHRRPVLTYLPDVSEPPSLSG